MIRPSFIVAALLAFAPLANGAEKTRAVRVDERAGGERGVGVDARPKGRAEAIEEGRKLVEKLQCSRCHSAEALPVAAAPRATSCAGCHAWIQGTAHDSLEYEKQKKRFPYWDRYVENVGSFLAVPDLATAGARLDEEWIARYVRDPYEVRPGLYERMLRAPVTEDEAKSIAAFLVSARAPLTPTAAEAAAIPASSAPAHVEEGRRLFAKLQCGTCHAIGADDATALHGAPDLAHARDRMSDANIAATIRTGTRLMPSFDLTAEESARLRDYIRAAPRETRAAPAVASEDLPLLTRAVSWEDVRSRVFGRVCVHCHMDPASNAGEGGPGNTGGLGFRGKGLNLETWEGIRASSVLTANPGEEPVLVRRLRARGPEHARELAGPHATPAPEGERGMPLALPPLSPEEMQLVRSWIAQGAPGPDGRHAILYSSRRSSK